MTKRKTKRTAKSRSRKEVQLLRAENAAMKYERQILFQRIYNLAAMFTGVVEASDDLRDMLTSLPGYNTDFPPLPRAKPVDVGTVNRSGKSTS